MKRNTKQYTIALTVVCLAMFYAGLKPKGFRLHNDVSWIGPENGIRFGRIGIAYSEKPGVRLPDSLSIELMLKVPRQDRPTSPVILLLWANGLPETVELLQWGNDLIVYKRVSGFFKDKVSRFGAEVECDKIHHVVITSCPEAGAVIYIDGVAQSHAPFSFLDQSGPLNRLAIGNSGNAHWPWHGEIYSLSMYKKVFTGNDVRGRYRQWARTGAVPTACGAVALYAFDDRAGFVAHDKTGIFGDLRIPAILRIPRKDVLTMPWKDFRLDRSFASDVAVNLIGFIPFGFLFFALLQSMGGSGRWRGFFFCVLAGASISLFFELVQVLMPTRESQLSDFLMNTLGTVVGTLIFGFYRRGLFIEFNSPKMYNKTEGEQ